MVAVASLGSPALAMTTSLGLNPCPWPFVLSAGELPVPWSSLQGETIPLWPASLPFALVLAGGRILPWPQLLNLLVLLLVLLSVLLLALASSATPMET
mmetsp:Transcript_126384/g.404642  ORF Transcript_126384/g.404642 Transcript_126384/m.404642 type:complete len:98 (+) Transcript_126384:2355-2648(+)